MRTAVMILVLLASPAVVLAFEETQASKANPIRKVVTMLQKMVETVEAEGKKEEKLFEEYMCYCKNGEAMLGKSIADANVKIPQLGSDIEEAEGQKSQLAEDLKTHKADSEAAKAAIAQATANRNKEAAAYAAESDESTANIAALKKALVAIEKGVGGAFLQTGSAQVVRDIVNKNQNLYDDDRQAVLAFLSQSSDNAAPSDQIIGILKQMGDEMEKSAAEAGAAEKEAIANFEGLMAAKTKETETLTASIEAKTQRAGELAVSIQEMKTELGDTEESLVEDKAFLADLNKNCGGAQKMWDERCKLRQEELLALADTIKMLNDDDALELFKKTLPSASASFVQVKVSASTMRAHALAAIRKVQFQFGARPQLDFIAMAMHGKQGGFDAIVKMIDDMIATLKKEQEDDDHKKEYCAEEFDVADDKKKQTEDALSDLETMIAKLEDSIATAKADIEALSDSIVALDKSVAEATENRKEENKDYTELMAGDAAAKELIGMAKNRMQKFYNPKLYKPPAKREITEEERLTMAAGGTIAPVFAQIQAHVQHKAAKADPGPPPTLDFGGSKKGEATGVLAMMDSILQDLDKEMTEAEAEEKDAQSDYEKMMKDSAAKRAEDSKLLSEKQAAKADMEADLEKAKEDKMTTSKQYFALKQYIATLHGECDWLLQYFDARKEARDSEIDAMGKAKSVLMGADYSLVQTKAKKNLRH